MLKVSVLVPIYNVSKYITRCVQSLFSQTIADDVEFIFVNDCSVDDSMEKLYAEIRKNPDLNITVLQHEKNKGLAAARNTAFEKANAEYFICVDSDDWVEPTYLEKLYNKIKNTDSDIVGCNLTKEFPHKSVYTKNLLPTSSDLCVKQLLLGTLQGWLHVKMVKRSLLLDNNISWVEGIDLWEDVLLSLKIFVYAKKIENIDESLYHYRFNTQSLVNTFNEKRIINFICVVREIESFFREKNMFNAYYDDFLIMKTRIKISILCEGDISLQKKYYSLYPEVDEKIVSIKGVSKIKKIATCLMIKQHYFISNLLLYLIYLGRKIKYR